MVGYGASTPPHDVHALPGRNAFAQRSHPRFCAIPATALGRDADLALHPSLYRWIVRTVTPIATAGSVIEKRTADCTAKKNSAEKTQRNSGETAGGKIALGPSRMVRARAPATLPLGG